MSALYSPIASQQELIQEDEKACFQFQEESSNKTQIPFNCQDLIIKSYVGKGHTSYVFRAEDSNGKPYALKKFNKPEFYEQELQILKRLREGPHILQLIQSRNDKGNNPQIVTKLLPNGDLFDYILKQKQLPEIQVKKYFSQLLKAVSFMHSQGVCHRDIKCENIMLDENMDLVLIDFGFAAIFDDYSQSEVKDQSLEKRFFKQMGTEGYMSPELENYKSFEQGYLGTKVDIFALGVVLFIMCIGRNPFNKADQRNGWYKKLLTDKQGYWKAFEQVAKPTNDFKDLFERMVEPDPEIRISLQEIEKHSWLNFDLELEQQVGLVRDKAD